MAEKTLKTETEKEIIDRVLKPAFGKYITRNKGFVEHLKDAKDRITGYINKPTAIRPLNILVAAPPGNGKSFLIKQLIESANSEGNLSFEEVYVASFDETTQIYSIFQRVQSINLEGKIPVVFFDEIDSEVNNRPIYQKFLAPMWDGTFFIGKERHFLGKCIFFFAGSSLSLEQQNKTVIENIVGKCSYEEYLQKWTMEFDKFVKDGKEKIGDFRDRLDLVLRIPPVDEKLLGACVEDEYRDLACMLILKNFHEVRLVGEIALRHICDVLKSGDSSIRKADKLVFSSKTLDSEKFDVFSFPTIVINTITIPNEILKNKKEEKFFDIKIE